jgi:choline kinase
VKAIILAAGRGTRLEPLTNEIPKALVPVGGVPLIDRMAARIGEAGLDEIVIVTGHGHDAVERHVKESSDPRLAEAHLVFNKHYADRGNYYSLLVAQDLVWDQDFVALDGDALLGPEILPKLLDAEGELILAVDRSVELGAEEMKVKIADDQVVALSKKLRPKKASGEFIGVERINAPMIPTVFDQLRQMEEDDEHDEYYERAFERMMAQGVEIHYADVSGCVWAEIDDAADLERANGIVARGEA